MDAINRKYFEICIGHGSKESGNDYWMCICGVKKLPSRRPSASMLLMLPSMAAMCWGCTPLT